MWLKILEKSGSGCNGKKKNSSFIFDLQHMPNFLPLSADQQN